MIQKKDILNRQEYIDKLIQIVNCLSEKKLSFCFAIDGEWGAGKTYVIDMFEEQIEKLQSEETSDNKYFVFNYNCWEYDYYEEPTIAIIATMLEKLEKEELLFGEKIDAFLNSSWGKAKEIIYQIAGEISKNNIGVNLVEIVKDINEYKDKKIENKYEFDEMFSFRKTLSDTREKLKELAQYKSILFIVDELDRCLPHYSIKVMERLHHLFDGISNITVLISMDSSQLGHSIKQIYGEKTDIDRYLKKFIDFTLILDKGILNEKFENKYIDYISYFYDFNENEKEFFVILFYEIFNGVDIRTQEKLMNKAKLIHEISYNNERLNPALLCFELMWIVLSYRTSYENLKWVLGMSLYLRPKEYLGEKLIGYIEDLEQSIGKHTKMVRDSGGKEFVHIDDILKDKLFWIFATVYYPVDNNKCYRYINEKEDDLKNEVEIAKKFIDIAEIMK